MAAKRVALVSIFPEMFAALTDYGITGRAVKDGLLEVRCWNPRDFTSDRHRTVDDRPYGGGPGMVMLAEPLSQALGEARRWAEETGPARSIYLSPQGRQLDQQGVEQLSQSGNLVLLAGRYEGIDERIVESLIDEEWSIGDYVLSGGELAAMVMVDAVTRLIPGALGHNLSAVEDSFAQGLLDCPHYTRPEEFAGRSVPEVLLSGNHEKIRRWRLKQALGRTQQRRPDLLEALALSPEQAQLLEEFLQESAPDEQD
ncbi:tRNA (guanosine(37)-N1)-methyltransferase TrmD [Microbulbifer agarilyticus]|uniref:tRNA (guanosine(37)-N1)-methyltransferase TrmD n=1 Tax=Microbulbifer agarilyticus TaxID=260552 RepID=UPI001C97B47E|nr:tRNA (guanosine(37)-N1)-methyltransferase TrmD [Microbulbifer agarilyticus]MBY6189791.1 tRNA (guanosine(37)-N1)-methyltransferase TrmD [Microbulbifer agarilyticus]MBY6211097.1 tRNA (guanosine(37)-N1)-methyltransferase TrmD [Microbulbifer agarilyticus]MCA0892322.1 tRNA (guanosine(37)-N1)-methyltransferase TrmD [Microbulbifer agarilyticus]MCA0900648.1 tRNA (guanosine(37)-N1)-methyltransferase TrmD [Microbulbifer agarilyticus]